MEGENQVPKENKPPKQALTLKLDFRLLSVLLLLVIAGMLVAWKPWDTSSGSVSQKMTVNGQVTLKAEPDEFVFYPTWQKKNADKDKALNELTELTNTVVAKLKELGVAEKSIKSNTSSYDMSIYYPEPGQDPTASTSITVTLNDKTLAQKVQDYLVTTGPTGQISPMAQFSESKQKSLEDEARTKAIEDAKAKAEKQAKQLSAKLGKVLEVKDGTGFGVMPVYGGVAMAAEARDVAKSSLTIQAGENDYSFTVEVTYALK